MKTRIPILASVMVTWLLSLAEASAFYDPGLQRWINRDPIKEHGGLNLFGFNRNAPLTFVDPLGLDTRLFLCGEDNKGLPFQKAAELLSKNTPSKPDDQNVIESVSGFKDINALLSKYKDISEVTFIGHGGPGILFVGTGTDPDTNITEKGGDHSLYNATFKSRSLKDLDFSNLLPHAEIHLYSCFSSRGGDDFDSIRNSLAAHLRGHRVWGGYFGTKFYPSGEPYTFPFYVGIEYFPLAK